MKYNQKFGKRDRGCCRFTVDISLAWGTGSVNHVHESLEQAVCYPFFDHFFDIKLFIQFHHTVFRNVLTNKQLAFALY